MKKILILLCAAVALFSCSKETAVPEETVSSPMTFNLTVSHPGDATKAALKTGWEDGDVVYVFFRDIPAKYLKLEYKGTAWTRPEPENEPLPEDFSGVPDINKSMMAVHIPHYKLTVSYDAATKKFYFKDASGNFIYTYYLESGHTPYTVSGTTVSGELEMAKTSKCVQFFVPGIPEAEAPLYRLREANLHPRACEHYDGDNFGGTTLDGGYALEGFPYKGGVLFAGALNTAGTATDYSFQLVKYVSGTKACAEGTYLLQGNRTIGEGVVLRFPELDSWSYGKWVDMGSAGKWATGNLTDDGGITVSEDNIVAPDAAGKYYAWGETVGYAPSGTRFSRQFDWADYKLANGASKKLTKYCYDASYGNEGYTDTLTELEGIDDAATVNLGSSWRMPTEAECEELVNTTRFEWLWQESPFVINGKLVTCKDTGLSLFLPAAGVGSDFELWHSGVQGPYWTSAIAPVYPLRAYSLTTGETYYQLSHATLRKEGRSIRPVYIAPPTVSFNLGGSYSGLGDEWDTGGSYGGGGNYKGFGDEYEM